MSSDNPFTVQAPAVAKAPRGPSPFAGIPSSDYARDGAALVLLLVSFAMHWNFTNFATERIEVILITLLSVFSLSITYLARTGVFPPSLTVRRVWMLRLLANLPYAALVLTYVVIDAAAGSNYTAGGLGFAAAFGLTGAILAAQPREAEVKILGHGAAVSELWYRIVVVFAAVAMLAGLVALILLLVRPGIGFVPVISVVVAISSVLLNLVGIVLAYVGILRRNEVGRLVALAIGTTMLGAILVDLFTGYAISVGGVESIHAVGYGAVMLSALAGLASSPAVRLAMNPVDDLHRWLRATSVLFIVIAGLAAFIVFLTILALGSMGGTYTGFGIGTIVTVVAIGLIAIVARTVFHGSPSTSRTLVLSLVALLLMLGIVHVVLAATGARVGILDLVLAFGLPLAVAVYLTVPQAIRDYYRSAPATSGVAPAPVHPTFIEQITGQIEPVLLPSVTNAQPAPGLSAALATSKIAQALDPTTPPAVLYQLAQEEPGLRPYLAANPSTYPDLLTWLGQLGDVAVDAALKARGVK